MKKTLISAAIAASGLCAFLPAAHAADGTISFEGRVNGTTCKVSGSGGSNDFTVTLPPVSAGSLASAGSSAGRTQFTLALSGCSPQTGMVQTSFEPGPSVSRLTGNLIPDTGAGAATNVEVGLLNDKFEKIKAGVPLESQNSQTAIIAGGAAYLTYHAQYESKGSATAGAVQTRVQYTMIYQ